MPKGDKSQAKAREMTLKICQGNGVSVVVKDGNTVIRAKGHSCCELKSKEVREENLNETNNGDFRKNLYKFKKK